MAQSFAEWQLADVHVTSKGAKQCQLSAAKEPVIYIPEEALAVPFGLSSWEESSRKNLELRCTSDVEASFLQLDEWARAYLVQHAERLFKKKLTPEQVAENYRSPLTKRGDYPALLRTKINTKGAARARIWNAQGVETEPPENWRDFMVRLKLHIRSLWIMGTTFGFTIECTDVQIVTPRRACPFTVPA